MSQRVHQRQISIDAVYISLTCFSYTFLILNYYYVLPEIFDAIDVSLEVSFSKKTYSLGNQIKITEKSYGT